MMFVSSLGTPFHQIDRLLYHKEKQKEFAYRLRSCLRVRALDEYYLGLGETRESERLLKALRFYEDCAAIAAELDDAEETISAHPELGPVWREIHRRTSEDEAYIVAEQATLGQLDKVKQLGIYVDVGASAVMSPRQFSKKDAELYLKAAEIITESIKLNDKTEYQVTCMTVTELP